MISQPPRRRQVQGRGRSRHPLEEFAASATNVAALGLNTTGLAAVCCRPSSGPGFSAAREYLAVAIRPPAHLVHWEWDVHGQQWAVLAAQSLPHLAAATARIEHALSQRGFGGLQNWSVFALLDTGMRVLHLVYDHRQRGFYPFVPCPGRVRDEATERELAATLSTVLPVVAERTQWTALWDSPLVGAS